MAAHQADLRAEVERERAAGAGAVAGATSAAVFAADIAAQGSEAAPTGRLRALLQFAERLALDPARFDEPHLQPLRDAGLDDRAIHDAAQVVAYFSYINRIADGLGVDLEPEME
ncbi:MAG TPA: hypothetical protein VFD43_13700 [Planctomycetota bacterium]|nr:hypothetical protein [Planctomycetota bacterium]